MDKFCEDCIHNEVCQYYAIPPHKDRCNDKDTLDDLIPQGEWIVYGRQGGIPITDYCSNCKYEMKWYRNKYNFCPNCGAKMKAMQNETDN